MLSADESSTKALTRTLPIDGIERTGSLRRGRLYRGHDVYPVWVLEGYPDASAWTEAKLLASYPTLRAADLVHAWAYVDAHRQEIDEEIRQNEAA